MRKGPKSNPPFDVEGAPPCIASEAVYKFSEIWLREVKVGNNWKVITQ